MMKLSKEEIEAKTSARLALISDFCSQEKGFQQSYLRMVPKAYQYLLYKVFAVKKSKADAIKAKCLDCSCFDRREVSACEQVACPLWTMRPYQKKED